MAVAERTAMPADLARLIEWHGVQLDHADFDRHHRPAYDRTIRLLKAIAAKWVAEPTSMLGRMREAAENGRCWYECGEPGCGHWAMTRRMTDLFEDDDSSRETDDVFDTIDHGDAGFACGHQDGCYFGAGTADRYVPLTCDDDERVTFSTRAFTGPVVLPQLHEHPLERGRRFSYYRVRCDVCNETIHSTQQADALSCNVCHARDIGYVVGFDVCPACAAAAAAKEKIN